MRESRHQATTLVGAVPSVHFGRQYISGGETSTSEDKDNPNPYKLMMYIATIICSLKRDFTGYDINPISLLEIKINDFDDYANEFNKYHKEIQAELDKAEKDGYIK